MSFSLLSLNCRGLGGIEKRRDVLNYLKQKNFSIYFLQDTHFTADDTSQIRSLWGYDIYISPGKSDARGTAISFNNNFEYNVNKVHTDSNGNLLVLEISVFRKYYIFVN
jgi:exonuclease III